MLEATQGQHGQRILTVRHAGVPLEFCADQVLVAVGRSANVEALYLDAAEVESSSGGIRVDPRLRTSNSSFYAIGDVASPLHSIHLTDADARMVVHNALFCGRAKYTDLVVPRGEIHRADTGTRWPHSARDRLANAPHPHGGFR